MSAPQAFGDADYQTAMLDLLPRGRIWRRDPGSVLARVLGALAPTYTRSMGAAIQLLVDTLPATTLNLLPEWEASLGLPDPCAGLAPTIQLRQRQVAARWAARGGQSKDYFIKLAASLGYTITITEYTPSMFGHPFGLPFAGTAWAYVWQVNAPTFTVERFLFGHDAFGEPFASWDNTVLQCEIQRLAPAHTKVIFSYS